jgi:hypothetical protein
MKGVMWFVEGYMLDIVTIEGNFFDSEFLHSKLHERFPKDHIVEFNYAGRFLNKLPDVLTRDTILVLEYLIPLFPVTYQINQEYEVLFQKFPVFTAETDTHKTVELLLQCVREAGFTEIPVVLYTGIDKEMISPTLLQDPYVHYVLKIAGTGNVLDKITELMTVKG